MDKLHREFVKHGPGLDAKYAPHLIKCLASAAAANANPALLDWFKPQTVINSRQSN